MLVLVSGGSVVASAGVASAAGGSVTEITAPAGGFLYAVSCWDATDCSTVGQDFHAQGANSNGTPISATETNGTWETTATEAPASNGGVFYGVKCWSGTDCIAVGNDWNLNDEPIFASKGAGGWSTPTELPESSGGYLYAVSCWDATHCMAVGADVAGEPIYAVLTASGGTWTSSGLNEVAIPQFGEFLGVSCWISGGTAGCTAVGDGDNHQPIRDTATESGTSWSWPAPTVITGAESVGKLTGISCVDAKDCSAVGVDTTTSNQPIRVVEAAGAWPSSITKVVYPYPTVYNAISCTDAKDCVVVGSEQTTQDLSAIYAGETAGAWGTPVIVAAPGGSGTLRGVDCAAASSCAAAGTDANGEPFVSAILRTSTRPGAPTSVSATPGNAQAVVTWSPPVSNGGSPIRSYTVSGTDRTTATNGGGTCTYTVGDPRPDTCTVLHLVNGNSYTFSVTATNADGTGPSSASSPLVKPTLPSSPGSPGMPAGLTATAMSGSPYVQGVLLKWNPPNRQISNYELKYDSYSVSSSGRVTSKPEDVTVPGTATEWNAQTALAGATDTFSLAERNGHGTGSAATISVLLDAEPAAPTVSIANQGSAVVLTWSYNDTADKSVGISAILGSAVYEGTSPGGESTTPLSTPPFVFQTATKGEYSATETIRGLTDGTTYYFTVALLNKAGPSKLSTEVSSTPGTPGAPTLTSATPGNGTIALTWTAPTSSGSSAITGYDVFEGSTLAEARSASPFNASLINGTSTTVTGLTPGKIHFFEISAVNGFGAGPRSNDRSGIALAGPSSPTLVSTTGNREVALEWKPPANDGGSPITGYDLYESITTGGEGAVPFAETSASTNQFLVTNDTISMRNGTTYYFTVAAVNAGGPGSASNEVVATPEPVPDPPQGLTATAGAESVTLSWSSPSSIGGSAITGYDVFEGSSPQGEGSTPVASAITKTSFTVTGLVARTTYYFLVEAINASGSSFPSNEASATPTPQPSPPSAPIGLTAVAGNREIRLSWSPPSSAGSSPITGYDLFEGTSPGAESATPFTQTVGIDFLVTNDLISTSNGTHYYFTVEAVNSFSAGNPSNEASATPEPVPGSPLNLTATPGVDSVSLNWIAPGDSGGSPISGYDIYEGASAGGESATPENAILITATSVTVIVQPPDSQHYFTVAAVNASGPGFPSGEAAATPEGLPGIPLNLKAAAGEEEASISWAKPPDGTCVPASPDYVSCEVSGYMVLWRKQGTSAAPATHAVTGATSTSFAISGLVNGVAYDVAVEATNESGAGAPTAWIGVTPKLQSPPAPPTALTGRAVSGTPETVLLRWTPPDPGGCTQGGSVAQYNACKVASYVVTYDTYSKSSTGTVTITHNSVTFGAGVTDWTRAIPLDGEVDTFTLAAHNTYGTGAAASVVLLLDAVPPAPDVTAVGHDGSVVLTWTYDDGADGLIGISPITGANVYEATSPTGFGATPIPSSENRFSYSQNRGVTTVTDTVSGLTNGSPYYFRVSQFNTAGQGALSAVVSASPGTP